MVMGFSLDAMAEALREEPWEGTGQGLLSSESFIWVPACLCAPRAPLCL